MTGRAVRIDPDGFAAALMLAFLATAGFFYVNIMAALVSGMVESLHYSASVAGRIGSFNVYGAAVGAFGAALVVGHVRWRPTAAALLAALIAADAGSTLVRDPSVMLWVRTLHGVFGGMLVGISFAVIARTRVPDRTFGMLLAVQAVLGGLGLMFLPRLVPSFGAPVLFLALAAFSALALAMLPFLPAYPPRSASSSATGKAAAVAATPAAPGRWALWVSLTAVFLFQLGNMAIGAYVLELGHAYSLGLGFMTATLGIAGWSAAAGALLVYWFGDRFGRAVPVAAAMVIALLGIAAFRASAVPAIYAAANVVTAITWMFAMPYLLGISASFDRRGRTAALAGLFSKLGLASGPLVASLLVDRGGYAVVVDVSLAAITGSAVCALAAARAVERTAAAAVDRSMRAGPG